MRRHQRVFRVRNGNGQCAILITAIQQTAHVLRRAGLGNADDKRIAEIQLSVILGQHRRGRNTHGDAQRSFDQVLGVLSGIAAGTSGRDHDTGGGSLFYLSHALTHGFHIVGEAGSKFFRLLENFAVHLRLVHGDSHSFS